MAWRALYYWFSIFRTTPYVDPVYLYKQKLYQEWYNGLTEEEQAYILQRRKERKEKTDRDFKQMISFMEVMTSKNTKKLWRSFYE